MSCSDRAVNNSAPYAWQACLASHHGIHRFVTSTHPMFVELNGALQQLNGALSNKKKYR